MTKCFSIPDCASKIAERIARLFTLEPPIPLPPRAEIETNCHAVYLDGPSDNKMLRLRIGAAYPNHPSKICRPQERRSIDVSDIDFDSTQGDRLVLAGVTAVGNGDDNKWFKFESKAGFAYLSVIALDTTETAARDICPDYSPIREVTAKFSRDGEWSDAFQEVGELTEEALQFGGQTNPMPHEMYFPALDKKTRYWGACQQGYVEVETVIVGGMPTHPPKETPQNPKQCELGPWAQEYVYEHRPVVPLDAFPSTTTYLCIRALESEPTPMLQGLVDLKHLRQGGEVTLAHDATDPRRVLRTWGPDSVTKHRTTSIFSVTLQIRKGK